MENWKELTKQKDLAEARATITKIDAAILLAKNNDFACEIHIAGLEIGLSNNAKIIPALKYEQKEIQKYLDGEPNEYE